jgi:hypothetical protein
MLRLIHTETNSTPPAHMTMAKAILARVYRDTEWDEYRVKLFVVGVDGVEVHRTRADFHTDDKADALTTAKTMVRDCKA